MRPSGPRKKEKPVRFVSLFAGIGGFDLGLERAGMQCVGQVEINPFCQRVLAHHWPHVKRIGDIRDVDGTEFGAVDLICGGFPCQPFSHAGKRKGKTDDRYLWPEMLRVIQAYRPAWVLGENVAGIVNMALDTVLSDLETQGYQCEAFIIPACAVDAKHERKRVWIVAHTDSGRRSPVVNHGGRTTENSRRKINIEPRRTDVSNSHSSGCGERRGAESIQSKQYPAQYAGQTFSYSINDGYNRTERNEAEPCSYESNNWLFERGNTWEPEPSVGRVANGVPGRVDRLRSLGNAVVPQVVEIIGMAIMATERAASMPQEFGQKYIIEGVQNQLTTHEGTQCKTTHCARS
jgi:DNA (cytosine-5)-methyltransferase 1